jgi:hypothetical protein
MCEVRWSSKPLHLSFRQASVASCRSGGKISEFSLLPFAAERISLSSLLMGGFPRWNVRHPADKLQKSR